MRRTWRKSGEIVRKHASGGASAALPGESENDSATAPEGEFPPDSIRIPSRRDQGFMSRSIAIAASKRAPVSRHRSSKRQAGWWLVCG